MKMVLQFQTVNQGNSGLYSGDATYLTELLFEQTSYADAKQAVQDVLSPVCKASKIQMTIDGNSGKWGCTFHFAEAAAPLPLSFGADLDSPEAIYDYYYPHVKAYIEQLNDERDGNGDYINEDIVEINYISEDAQSLAVEVKYENGKVDIIQVPYPIA